MSKVSYLKKKVAIFLVAAAMTLAMVFAGATVRAYAAPSSGTINDDGVNVREEPVDGEPLDKAAVGTEVSISDETDGSDGYTWYKVTYQSGDDSITGWVRSDFISDSDGTSEDGGTAAEGDDSTASDTTDEYASAGDSSYVVSSSIPSELYPEGFSEVSLDYQGTTITALQDDNADVTLLYVENASDPTVGKLVIYDMSRSELIPYINFTTADGFIILQNLPSQDLLRVSDRYVQTTYTFEGQGDMDALQLVSADDLVSGDVSVTDFYYMYGVDQDGTYGWYVYDAKDGTIQRNTENMQYTIATVENDDQSEQDTSSSTISSIPKLFMIVALVIIVLLLVIVIVFAIRYRKLLNEEEDYDYKAMSAKKSKSGGHGGGMDIPVGKVRTTRPKRETKPVEDDVDDYDSFSAALEKMAATESASAAGDATRTSARKSSGFTQEMPVKQTARRSGFESGSGEAASEVKARVVKPQPEDDDDDIEFL